MCLGPHPAHREIYLFGSSGESMPVPGPPKTGDEEYKWIFYTKGRRNNSRKGKGLYPPIPYQKPHPIEERNVVQTLSQGGRGGGEVKELARR